MGLDRIRFTMVITLLIETTLSDRIDRIADKVPKIYQNGKTRVSQATKRSFGLSDSPAWSELCLCSHRRKLSSSFEEE